MFSPVAIVVLPVTSAPSTGPSRAGSHRISSYQQCPRLYAIYHVEKLQPPVQAPPLAKGSMIHLGLLHHYGLVKKESWARDPIKAMWDAPSDIAYVFEEAQAVVQDYRKVYPVEKEPFRVLDLEREFEIRVGDFPVTARLDMTVEQGGKACIYETKSGEQIRNVRSWTRSGQILTQVIIGRALFKQIYGLEFGGLWVNAVRTGPNRDARRLFVEPSEDAIKTWPKSTHYWLKRIADDEKHLGKDAFDWPEAHTSCRYCDAHDACNKGRFMLADWVKR